MSCSYGSDSLYKFLIWSLEPVVYLVNAFSCYLKILILLNCPNISTGLLKLCRGIGPWGPDLVRKYTSARFSSYSTGDLLTEEESKLLTGSLKINLLLYCIYELADF